MESDHPSDKCLPMNPLQRALIEKAGHDNGFEYVLPGDAQHVALASARHPARVRVSVAGQGFEVAIDTGSATLAQELARTFAASPADATTFVLPSEALLAHWLRRTAALSQALPNQAVIAFEQQVQTELAELAPAAAQNTEVLRMVRQRVGQQAYRQAMMDYWGGACAVTGIALPQALRASHAKPWAACATDAERLDDRKDQADRMAQATVRDAEATRDHDELVAVRAALARIDQADIAGAGNVRTAAQFAGGADIDDAHLIAVLLPEEHHGPEFLSLSDGHHTMQAVDVFQNLGVDEVLHTVNFLVGQRLVVHKVETRLVGIDLRPFLLHMIAEHFAQRLVHQVRRRMVADGTGAGQNVNFRRDAAADLQAAGAHPARGQRIQRIALARQWPPGGLAWGSTP